GLLAPFVAFTRPEVAAALVRPEVAAAVRPELAALTRPELAAKRPELAPGRRPEVPEAPAAARTSLAWPFTLTLRQTFSILPCSSIRKVVRSMPMKVRP